ncbi:hypothetical protein [Streptomyces sp. NPDC000878]
MWASCGGCWSRGCSCGPRAGCCCAGAAAIGDTYLAVGGPGSARAVWEHALRLLVRTDPTAASELRTRLRALGDAVPAPRISAVPAYP